MNRPDNLKKAVQALDLDKVNEMLKQGIQVDEKIGREAWTQFKKDPDNLAAKAIVQRLVAGEDLLNALQFDPAVTEKVCDVLPRETLETLDDTAFQRAANVCPPARILQVLEAMPQRLGALTPEQVKSFQLSCKLSAELLTAMVVHCENNLAFNAVVTSLSVEQLLELAPDGLALAARLVPNYTLLGLAERGPDRLSDLPLPTLGRFLFETGLRSRPALHALAEQLRGKDLDALRADPEMMPTSRFIGGLSSEHLAALDGADREVLLCTGAVLQARPPTNGPRPSRRYQP